MKASTKIFATSLTLAVLFAAGCKMGPNDSTTGEKLDDTVITTKVKAAILNDPELKSSEITVNTFKGVVQLSGFVTDASDVAEAGKVARSVSGVTSVKNDLLKR